MNTKFETNILNNGLTVKHIKNEHLHSVNIGIYARKLPEKICGIAHMTEHMFFRRLCDIPQRQLYFETDKIGATLKGATYADFICLDITVSPSKIREAFLLISKVFKSFEWQPQEVEAEKRVVKRQIEDRYNSLYSRADMKYYESTPKGSFIMGNISDINRISAKCVNEYRKSVFVPKNCCVVLTGNFSDNDLWQFINELEKFPMTDTGTNLMLPKYTVKEFCSRSSASDKIYGSSDGFSDVSISFDVDESSVNRYAAEILQSIIGYGVTSKLSQVLREELGFTSEIGGSVEFTGYSGRMSFEFEVYNENIEESLTAVFDILQQAKYGLTENDMQSSKVFYTDNQYRLLDDVRELNFLIGWRTFVENVPFCSLDELIRKYDDITVSDINEAANQIFHSQNLVISVSNDNNIYHKIKLNNLFENLRKEL